VRHLSNLIPVFDGLRVLDGGCGEGKNAAFLAACGADVTAVDISEIAVSHAKQLWAASLPINWKIANIVELPLERNQYDVVIAYGLLHCLNDATTIRNVVLSLQNATQPGGYHVVVALNSRAQDLRAHPDLNPCLIPHTDYIQLYDGWNLDFVEDADLHETHPHNRIPHSHSITRILARKAEQK